MIFWVFFKKFKKFRKNRSFCTLMVPNPPTLPFFVPADTMPILFLGFEHKNWLNFKKIIIFSNFFQKIQKKYDFSGPAGPQVVPARLRRARRAREKAMTVRRQEFGTEGPAFANQLTFSPIALNVYRYYIFMRLFLYDTHMYMVFGDGGRDSNILFYN